MISSFNCLAVANPPCPVIPISQHVLGSLGGFLDSQAPRGECRTAPRSDSGQVCTLWAEDLGLGLGSAVDFQGALCSFPFLGSNLRWPRENGERGPPSPEGLEERSAGCPQPCLSALWPTTPWPPIRADGCLSTDGSFPKEIACTHSSCTR